MRCISFLFMFILTPLPPLMGRSVRLPFRFLGVRNWNGLGVQKWNVVCRRHCWGRRYLLGPLSCFSLPDSYPDFPQTIHGSHSCRPPVLRPRPPRVFLISPVICLWVLSGPPDLEKHGAFQRLPAFQRWCPRFLWPHESTTAIQDRLGAPHSSSLLLFCSSFNESAPLPLHFTNLFSSPRLRTCQPLNLAYTWVAGQIDMVWISSSCTCVALDS